MGKRGRKNTVIKIEAISTPSNSPNENAIPEIERGLNFDKMTNNFQFLTSALFDHIPLDKLDRAALKTVLNRSDLSPVQEGLVQSFLNKTLAPEGRKVLQTVHLTDKEAKKLEIGRFKKQMFDALFQNYVLPIEQKLLDWKKAFEVKESGDVKKTFTISQAYSKKINNVPIKFAFALVVSEDAGYELSAYEKAVLEYNKDCEQFERDLEVLDQQTVINEYKGMVADKAFVSQFTLTDEDKDFSAKTSFSK